MVLVCGNDWLYIVRTNLFPGGCTPGPSLLRPTLTLPCFRAQHTSHWPTSPVNTLQYKLQNLQLHKLKICSILLPTKMNKCRILHKTQALMLNKLVHTVPLSCWSLPRNNSLVNWHNRCVSIDGSSAFRLSEALFIHFRISTIRSQFTRRRASTFWRSMDTSWTRGARSRRSTRLNWGESRGLRDESKLYFTHLLPVI